MTERKRLTIDVLVEDDQYWGKVDMMYVVEQLSTQLKEVIFANQGIVVEMVEPTKHFIHDHEGENGCQYEYSLAEDQQPYRQ